LLKVHYLKAIGLFYGILELKGCHDVVKVFFVRSVTKYRQKKKNMLFLWTLSPFNGSFQG